MPATNGNDVLIATMPGELIDGLGGDDTISSAFWDSTLIGGTGLDRITTEVGQPDENSEGQASPSEQYGGDGGDTLIATLHPKAFTLTSLQSGEGDDDIVNGDFLSPFVMATQAGGDGNDSLTAKAVGPTVFNIFSAGLYQTGGAGNDTLSTEALAGDVDSSQDGGTGSDRLTISIVAETARSNQSGGDGNDSIKATVDSGYGNVTLSGGGGDDTIAGSLFEKELDFQSLLTQMFTYGGEGNDTITSDVTSSLSGRRGVAYNFTDGGGGNDVIRVEAYGYYFAFGSRGENVVNGGDGNDDIEARSGSGSASNPYGSNTIDAGSGDDRVLAVASASSTVAGGTAVNDVTGGSGSDVLETQQAGHNGETLFKPPCGARTATMTSRTAPPPTTTSSTTCPISSTVARATIGSRA